MVRRKPTGPKPLPPERLRTRIVGVKVNGAEFRRLAEAAGPYPVATWARAVLMAATEDPSPIRDSTPKSKKGGRR
jgi:hypothetical protein